MDLRQRLSLLTKLVPNQQQAAVAPAPLGPAQGIALPSSARAYREPLPGLACLADPCLLPELRNYLWEQVAFIDTETTGLSTGTGTYVILIGIGTISQGVFTVRQYFLPDPAQEADFWSQVLADLQSYPMLCTFNGKSYDLPLINARLTMMGMPGLEPAAHLDLLHPARRLWRRVLLSCALQSLEENRLDWHRENDVPGALIPSIYYDYLQSGDSKPLQAIFTHNCRDIVSLFELTVQLAEVCAQPQQRLDRAEEFFGLADAYLRIGISSAAEETIIAGLQRPGDQVLKRRYLYKLAKLQARDRRYEQALHTWGEVAKSEPLSPTPQIEMAKIYEHHLRDVKLAWQAVKQAAAICHRRDSLGVPVPEAEKEDLYKRLRRLERRTARHCLGASEEVSG